MKKAKNALIFTLGILFLPLFLLTPVLFSVSHATIINSVRTGADPFYALAPTDLAQDIVGFRAMNPGDDPYPVLSSAAEKYGLGFPVDAKSTHPPTTFLFVAPIAFLSWPLASRIWALFTLIGIICTFRLFEFDWPLAIGYGCLSLFWLPLMQSLAQFTVLWLLLITIAYRIRNRYPFWRGFCIGLAPLLKILPVILLIPFLLAKKWQMLYGFLLATMTGGIAVLLISPKALFQYLESQHNAQSIFLRTDNASLFPVNRVRAERLRMRNDGETRRHWRRNGLTGGGIRFLIGHHLRSASSRTSHRVAAAVGLVLIGDLPRLRGSRGRRAGAGR